MEQRKTGSRSADIVPVRGARPLAGWHRHRHWPERDVDAIFDEFRRSFDLMLQPYLPREARLEESGILRVRYAPLDVIDEGDHYVVRAGLPGFTKDEVEVEVNSDAVSIRAKKDAENEESRKNYIQRECTYAAYERSFFFPEEVDPAKAMGEMKEGVLELKVTKKTPRPEAKPRKIAIR